MKEMLLIEEIEDDGLMHVVVKHYDNNRNDFVHDTHHSVYGLTKNEADSYIEFLRGCFDIVFGKSISI